MKAEISLVFLILVVVSQNCDGLICYACSSSESVFDANCDSGNNKVRSGVCPSNFRACSVKRFTYPDGSKGVLRDCAISMRMSDDDEILSPGETRLATSEYKCDYNYCNDNRSESAVSTASTEASTTEFASAANYLLGQPIWVLAGLLFFYLHTFN